MQQQLQLLGAKPNGTWMPGEEGAPSVEALEFVAELVRQFAPCIRLVAPEQNSGIRRHTLHMSSMAPTADGMPQTSHNVVCAKPQRQIVVPACSADMFSSAMDNKEKRVVAEVSEFHGMKWRNTAAAHANLDHAIKGGRMKQLVFRPRPFGWFERGMLVDGGLVPAALFDAGLFIYNCSMHIKRGVLSPQLEIPGVSSRAEAVLWNSIIHTMEGEINITPGAVTASLAVERACAPDELGPMLDALEGRTRAVCFYPETFLTDLAARYGISPGCILPHISQLMRGCAPVELAMEQVATEAESKGLGLYSAGGIVVNASSGVSDLHGGNFGQPRIDGKGLESYISAALRFLANLLSPDSCATKSAASVDGRRAELYATTLWQWSRSNSIASDGRVVHADLLCSMTDRELARALVSTGGEGRKKSYHIASRILKKSLCSWDGAPSLARMTENMFGEHLLTGL